MGKPLLYAFGGLPVALLGVLLMLGHQPAAVEDPQTTETLTPATPLAPEIDSEPIGIPAEVKPPVAPQPNTVTEVSPPRPVITDDVVAKLPPETIGPPRGHVDGGDETAELAPAPVKPRDVPEPKIAASEPPPATIAPPRVQVDGSDETADPVAAPIKPRDAPEMKIAAAEPPPAIPPAATAPPVFGNDRPQIAAQDSATTPDGKTMGRVIVQSGNTLWRLSRVIYGKGRDYVTIAEANRDIIRDPALIYPGQVIAIPGATPPEKIDPRRKRPLPPTDGSLSLAQ